MSNIARRWPLSFARWVAVVLVAMIATIGASRAGAQVPIPGKPNGVEKWMRDYQAHMVVYLIVYGSTFSDTSPAPNLLVWPSTYDGKRAPYFPSDGFYDESFRHDPNFGPYLVNAMTAAFHGVGDIWVDEYDAHYPGFRLWTYYMRDTDATATGSVPLSLTGHEKLPNLITHHDDIAESPMTYFLGGYDFPVSTDLVYPADPVLLPDHISVSSTNYLQVFAYLQNSVKRLDRIHRTMWSSCPYDTGQLAKGYHQQDDLAGTGSELDVFSTLYPSAWVLARDGWLSASWTACPVPNGGNLTTTSVGPPMAQETVVMDRTNNYGGGTQPRWVLGINTDRRAGYMTFDYGRLFSKYEAYVAVEPGPQNGAFAAGIPTDRKYHLLGQGTGWANYKSSLIGYDTANPLSSDGDVPAGPICETDECQRWRIRGWRIWPESSTDIWQFDSDHAAVVVFTPDFEEIGRQGERMNSGQCSSCGGPTIPSGPKADTVSVHGATAATLVVPLGVDTGGNNLGTLGMAAGSLSPVAILPESLSLSTYGSQRVLMAADDEDHARTVEIRTGRAVLKVRDTTTTTGTDPHTSTRIDAYSDTSSTNSSALYQTTILDLRMGKQVQNPAAPTSTVSGNELTVTTTGQCASQSRLTQVGDNWEIATGFDGPNYLRRERIVKTTDPITEVVTLTRSVVGANDVVVSVSSESTKSFAWGVEVVARTSGQVGSGMGVHGETYAYHENATITGGDPNPSYKRLKSVTTTPEGAWRHFEYDAFGNVVTEIAQFANSSYGSDVSTLISQGRSRQTTFGTGNPTGGGSVVAQIAQTVEKLKGTAVTRTCTMIFPGGTGKYAGTGETETWTIRCASPDEVTPTSLASSLATTFEYPWTGANQVEIEVSHVEPFMRSTRRIGHDGSLAISTTTENESTHVRTTVVDSGPSNPERTAIRGGTRSTSVVNAQGITTSSKTEEFDPSGSPVIVSQTTVNTIDIDEYGRVTKWHHFDGSVTQASFDCCGKDYTTDGLGVKTWYTYDALKREVSSSRQVGPTSGTTTPVIMTLTTYDADGRVLTESRKGTDNSTMLLSSNLYDLGGRMKSTKNALDEETTYTEVFEGGFVVSTEKNADPDGSGSLLAPTTIRVAFADGTPVNVNVPFDPSYSATAPQQFATGATTLSGVGTVRTSTRYASDVTTLTNAYPRSMTYTNALGQTVQTDSWLTATAVATQRMSYDPETHIQTQIDPDGVRSFSVSGYGTADATAYLGYTVPTALEPYFKCRWSLTALDVNGDGNITFSATSPALADRITVSSSWLSTRLVGGVSTPVRHSASIVWKSDASASNVIETSSSDTTLDGLKSWTMSAGKTSSVVTVNGTAQRTVTNTDDIGGVTESRESYGRQAYSKRYHPGSVFGGKTEFEYDAHGRLSKTHMLHTDTASWNSTDDDVTETTYGYVDRVATTTAPSPNGGTGTGGGTRHVTSYDYDHLGRVIQVTLPGSKTTTTTYNARGQVMTVRGFGVNPVDYAYDTLGRMTDLSTYQNVGGSSQGKATTKWAYDPFSGRLLNKKYQGNTSSIADLAYTYKDSGRPLTRTTKRGIVTTYAYDTYTGEPIATTYSDSTPSTLITARDRLGRPNKLIDAAGQHSLTYTDDGRPWGDFVSSDSGVSGAPHQNILAGVSIYNGFEFNSTSTGAFPVAPRESLDVVMGSIALNHVEFGYDAEERPYRVTKSGGQVDYAFDPITGQVTSSTSKFNTSFTTYEPRIEGTRGYDRLGRMTGIAWANFPPVSTPSTSLLARGYATDIHGRRTAAVVGFGESIENWSYGYDDLGQLSSASGSFAYTSPLVLVPGLQFTYEHDDIGNRKTVVQGSSSSGGDSYSASYARSLLNQYDSRDIPGKIEVSGHSAASTVYVNSAAATRYADFDGFFHKRLTVNNTGPLRESVAVDEGQSPVIPYDVFVPASTETFGYDADGNLSSDGIWDYVWDAENRLIQMTMKTEIAGVLVGGSAPWQQLKFAYDGMGRRIQKTLLNTSDYSSHVQKGDLSEVVFDTEYLHKYIYDIGSWNLSSVAYCNTTTGAIQGAWQSFAWGPDLSATENGAGGIGGLAIYLDDYIEGGGGTGAIGPMFPLYDGNGNILRLYSHHVDSNNVPDRKKAEYQYGPFGEQRGQTGSQAARFPFRWSTKFTDNETGLVYYGYRYYSASMGRWLSRDPLQEQQGAPLYRSCYNAPIGSVDSVGLSVLGSNIGMVDLSISGSIGLYMFGNVVQGTGTYGVQAIYDCNRNAVDYYTYWGGGLTFGTPSFISVTGNLGVGLIYGNYSTSNFSGIGYQVALGSAFINGNLLDRLSGNPLRTGMAGVIDRNVTAGFYGALFGNSAWTLALAPWQDGKYWGFEVGLQLSITGPGIGVTALVLDTTHRWTRYGLSERTARLLCNDCDPGARSARFQGDPEVPGEAYLSGAAAGNAKFVALSAAMVEDASSSIMTELQELRRREISTRAVRASSGGSR